MGYILIHLLIHTENVKCQCKRIVKCLFRIELLSSNLLYLRLEQAALLQRLRMSDPVKDTHVHAEIYLRIGDIYLKSFNPITALDYITKALHCVRALSTKKNSCVGEFSTVAMMAKVYDQLDRPDPALNYMARATELLEADDHDDAHDSMIDIALLRLKYAISDNDKSHILRMCENARRVTEKVLGVPMTDRHMEDSTGISTRVAVCLMLHKAYTACNLLIHADNIHKLLKGILSDCIIGKVLLVNRVPSMMTVADGMRFINEHGAAIRVLVVCLRKLETIEHDPKPYTLRVLESLRDCYMKSKHSPSRSYRNVILELSHEIYTHTRSIDMFDPATSQLYQLARSLLDVYTYDLSDNSV